METSAWTPGRVRRSRMFAATLFTSAVIALLLTNAPWVAMSTGGTPSCDGSGRVVSAILADGTTAPVAAAGCASGWQLAHESSADDPFSALPRTAGPSLPAPMGVPDPVFWLAVAALVACAGLMMRSSVVIALSLAGWKAAYDGFGSVMSVAAPGDWGKFAAAQWGLSALQALATVQLSVLVGALILTFRANRADGSHKRGYAIAEEILRRGQAATSALVTSSKSEERA